MHSERACVELATALVSEGNFAAAKAVIQHAPGCHGRSSSGAPEDECFFRLAQADHLPTDPYYDARRLFTDDEMLALARDAFSYDPTDEQAAQYLKGHGARIDLDAVGNAAEERAKADRDARREANAQAQAEAAKPSFLEKINNTLQQMPGANDPDAILNAGNQQAAAIRAIGDANAARQQAVAAQQQAAAQQRAAALQAQQNVNQASSTSGGNNNSYNGSGTGSTGSGDGLTSPIAGNCVGEFWDPKYYNWLSFQNNCGQAIYLTWIAKNPSDSFGASGANLAVSESTNSGWNQSEVAQKQNFALFICPTGYLPVDVNTGQQVRDPNAHYKCKRQ